MARSCWREPERRADPHPRRSNVVLGPDIRRGIADWNGEGDVVGGIVVMRQGEDALSVIERVKQKLKDIEPGLPKGSRCLQPTTAPS